MTGAMYLTQENERISQVYNIGEDIDTFSDKEELYDKVRFYLNNSRERIENSGKGI